MGTDIHFIAQRRDGDKWVNVTVDRWKGYDHDKQKEIVELGEFHYSGGRDYYFFAWLADVRNGYGFAGVKTFEPVKPLTSHRGLPPDVEVGHYDEALDDFVGNYLGEHSRGWATAREILAHERKPVLQTGVLSLNDYKAHRDSGKLPESWSGDIAGRGIVVVDSSQIHDRPDATHVRAVWVQPDDRSVGEFVSAVKEMADKYGPDNFRVVFGFDS